MKEVKIKNKKSRVFAGGHVKFTVQMKAFFKKFGPNGRPPLRKYRGNVINRSLFFLRNITDFFCGKSCLLCIVMLNHKNAKPRKMKTNPHHPTGFGSCSDRALAEKATAFYDAISNHTGLASSLPGFETFNAARLAFMEALEKAGFCMTGA
jgi:hypothetical protein